MADTHTGFDEEHGGAFHGGIIPEGIESISIPIRALTDRRLTPSTKLVLGLVAAGVSETHVEMAAVLGLTPITISKCTRILRLLGYLEPRKYAVR